VHKSKGPIGARQLIPFREIINNIKCFNGRCVSGFFAAVSDT